MIPKGLRMGGRAHIALIVKCRRLDHDYERLPETGKAMVDGAMIGLMVRRLPPPPSRRPWQHASTAA